MNDANNKSGFLIAYQLLDSLYNGDEPTVTDSISILDEWCTANSDAVAEIEGFTVLKDNLTSLMRDITVKGSISMREANTLRSPLVRTLKAWIEKINIKLFLQTGMQSRETLCVKRETNLASIGDDYSGVPDTDENSIHITLSLEPEALDEAYGKVDVNITTQELFERARFCFPMDSFDYDRLYLSGKLQSLMTSRNDTSIILAGSSYAMVGLKESLMPRPATNLAVNAQDPYFTFLSVKTAKKYCSAIDAVVIAGGYYFWHTDMSDDPSDYHKSVLTRTNYPVLKKLHNYKGDLLQPMLLSQSDPFLEEIFDLQQIYKKEHNRIALRLASLEYFNPEYNVRPKNGMLRYPFRDQTDDVNDKAAEARAKAHNRNFNQAHLRENISELNDFLLQMEKKNVRVIILVPPVTKFYRRHSSRELRDAFYALLAPVKEARDFTFLDLFDSEDFDLSDFQDYDHVNEAGAIKLSGIISKIV